MPQDDRSYFPEGEVPAPGVEETPWNERVAYGGAGGYEFAFTPGRIHVRWRKSDGELLEFLNEIGLEPLALDLFAEAWWAVGVPPGQEIDWVDRVTDEGVAADLDYVLFSDGMRSDPFMASPFMASPFMASPFMASPFMASDYTIPFLGNPTYGNPIPWEAYKEAGVRPSSARSGPIALYCHEMRKSPANVVVIDTGLAGDVVGGPKYSNPILTARGLTPAPGNEDSPDRAPAAAPDGFLDPAAGHGTFIAGIVELLGYPRTLDSIKAISPYGDVNVQTLVQVLRELIARRRNPNLIVNLSFSGRGRKHMKVLAEYIARLQRTGAVVVASAGNDAAWQHTYPAALPDVVSVGGLSAYGAAPFTNYGDWVRACAPAVDVVSTFFNNFNGPVPVLDVMGSADAFNGWAVWSGTSFAAPAVVAALCRHMFECGGNAKEAVEWVVDNPSRHRVLGLGTVVNLTLAAAPARDILIDKGQVLVVDGVARNALKKKAVAKKRPPKKLPPKQVPPKVPPKKLAAKKAAAKKAPAKAARKR